MTTTHQRYFNVTMIDIAGSPASTQVFASDDVAALQIVQGRADEGCLAWATPENVHDAWTKPLIAAYIFDTKTRRRLDIEVTSFGRLVIKSA